MISRANRKNSFVFFAVMIDNMHNNKNIETGSERVTVARINRNGKNRYIVADINAMNLDGPKPRF